MATIATEVKAERKVSLGLLAGIILAPLIFVWFTLRKGHSTLSRVLAFLWLIIAFVASTFLSIYNNASSGEYVDPWADKVSMAVQLGGSDCKDPTPVAVTILNNSDVELLAYRWNLSVKAKGHSSELVFNRGSNGSSDLILKPGHEVTFCQEIPMLTDNSYPLDELEFRPGAVWVDNPDKP